MSSFPLAFGKSGKTYQIDMIVDKNDSAKHLVEIGFVKDAKIEILNNQKQAIIVKILNSKIALDYSIAQKIYVREFHMENIETL